MKNTLIFRLVIVILFFLIWAMWGAMSWLVGWLVSGVIPIHQWSTLGVGLWVGFGVLVGAALSYVVINQFINPSPEACRAGDSAKK